MALAHRLIQPLGAALRAANPRAYELLRWKIARSGFVGDLLGRPMYHQLVLPFLVRPGDTVLDIGANTGQYTVPLSRLVGPQGRVHAFEPIPATFAELGESVRRVAGAGNVVLNQLALGETPGSMVFTVPLDRPTEATAVAHSAQQWADYAPESPKYARVTCAISTVDAYVRDHEIGCVSFLKCDVEGAEFSVLKGATGLLSGPRPPAIQLEVFEGWTKSFGYSPRDLFAFLRATGGYEVYWFHEAGLRRIGPNDTVIPGIFFEWVDFLCVVPGVHDRRFDITRFQG